MGEELIRPIKYIPEGVCPRCLSLISIYESEIVELDLDEDGLPIKHDVKYSRLYGKCRNCGADFMIKKNGMRYSITSKLAAMLEKEQLEALADANNPFGYNSKGD